ncbi:MAG: GFA family protein, partial [Alphaproteobacteria bacterium]|nr:GFA family protein [Alphaproteobacteria bacterium]
MLTGTCHCGAAHWTFEGDPGAITACNCTLCRRYGAL